jgi:hypothetical protein
LTDSTLVLGKSDKNPAQNRKTGGSFKSQKLTIVNYKRKVRGDAAIHLLRQGRHHRSDAQGRAQIGGEDNAAGNPHLVSRGRHRACPRRHRACLLLAMAAATDNPA